MSAIKKAIDGAMEALVVPSFTSIGIGVRRRLFDWDDESLDLTDRVVLITGATSGLGYAAAERCGRLGASLRLLGRDRSKTESYAERLRGEAGLSDVSTYVADVSDLAQVRRVAGEIVANEDRLDVLVHNAGALLNERTESAQGHEMSLATMVLGPFLLTSELKGLLEASDDPRVITVSSGGMYTQGLDLDDLQFETDYSGARAYARAKRAQVVLTEMAAERHGSITYHSMHPGWADTPGVVDSLPGFYRLMKPLLRTPEQGADTIVWLAASPRAKGGDGAFWHDRAPRSKHKLGKTRSTVAERAALWNEVVRLTSGP